MNKFFSLVTITIVACDCKLLIFHRSLKKFRLVLNLFQNQEAFLDVLQARLPSQPSPCT